MPHSQMKFSLRSHGYCVYPALSMEGPHPTTATIKAANLQYDPIEPSGRHLGILEKRKLLARPMWSQVGLGAASPKLGVEQASS